MEFIEKPIDLVPRGKMCNNMYSSDNPKKVKK
jgi:hypothetical protein